MLCNINTILTTLFKGVSVNFADKTIVTDNLDVCGKDKGLVSMLLSVFP